LSEYYTTLNEFSRGPRAKRSHIGGRPSSLLLAQAGSGRAHSRSPSTQVKAAAAHAKKLKRNRRPPQNKKNLKSVYTDISESSPMRPSFAVKPLKQKESDKAYDSATD
jgi:hypothetical protein